MAKSIIMTLALIPFFGCASAQSKELISVYYHRSGMRSDDRISIKVKKTAETYAIEFEKGTYKENNSTSFEITRSDFDELSSILFKMSKPGKERRGHVRDLMESLDVEFVQNGKQVSRRYSINQDMNKKTAELKEQAIDLLYERIDKYKKQFEIRVNYSKGIATPTEIYTHAEPADLVENLCKFIERLDPNSGNQEGGTNYYSHRWRALKPGVVTVWFEELIPGPDIDEFPEEFEPHACYVIDENLHVRYSKEETEAARERFKRRRR